MDVVVFYFKKVTIYSTQCPDGMMKMIIGVLNSLISSAAPYSLG
jgi:hypothetical protein